MSNTPGISPITTDIEEVRHSDGDGFFGDEGSDAALEEESEEVDEGAREVVEEDHGRVVRS